MPKSKRTDDLQEYIQSEKGLKELTELAREGKTMTEIASHLGINRATLYTWSTKYPEVKSALTEGKKVADERVEQSLYEMCFGRNEREITIEKDEDGNVVKQIIRTRYIPPNVTAIQYWLQNRCNDKWKDRRQMEVTGDGVLPIMFVEDIPNPYADKKKKKE